jgi:uncharacterized protein
MSETEISQEFLLSCRYGELEVIKQIFTELESNKRSTDFLKSDSTFLFYLAGNGHFEALEYVIKRLSVDVNVQNNEGNTPLHWASLNGQQKIVELLLQRKANPTIRNNAGLSPATLAESRDFMETVKVLLAAYDPEDEEDEGEDQTFSTSDPAFKQEQQEQEQQSEVYR